MDRVIWYPGEQISDSDLLTGQKNGVVGLAFALNAILGPGPYVDGLATTPGTGLTVSVAPGSIYAQAQTDATSYGSLGTDTRTIVKQGLLQNAATLSCPAPGTSGQSINYLVEVQYQDVDGGSTLLPYYDSSNPSVPYSGPANDGIAQNTLRQGICAVQVKAGTAAAAGSQTTPAADSGWTGIYVVTVANGATSIVTGNIAMASGAPFINPKLPAIGAAISAAQAAAEAFATAADVAVLSTAETYAASQASAAQSNAETYAASQAATAQSNAETYAASQASAAQSNAETYAASQAATAQSNAETYAASQASAAQSAAETYANGLITTLSNSNGHAFKLPGGYCHQWGAISVAGNGGTASVTFPEAFNNNCDAVLVTMQGVGSTAGGGWCAYGYSTTGCTIQNNTNATETFAWNADGR